MTSYKDYLKNHPSPGTFGVVSDQMKGVPIPSIQKPYPESAELIDLIFPKDFDFVDISLLDAIQKRRTRRLFTEKPFSLKELSFLLWATQGVQQVVRSGYFTLRTVPSAGGMHPFETYLVIDRVETLQSGLYRYLAIQHKLYQITDYTDLPGKLVEACNNQDFVSKGAVVIIWTVRPYRSEWRNGENALKDILISAGHVGQNLYLACEAIGAGVSPILTYRQELLDELVGVDGEDELAIYLASVGKVDVDVIQL